MPRSLGSYKAETLLTARRIANETRKKFKDDINDVVSSVLESIRAFNGKEIELEQIISSMKEDIVLIENKAKEVIRDP